MSYVILIRPPQVVIGVRLYNTTVANKVEDLNDSQFWRQIVTRFTALLLAAFIHPQVHMSLTRHLLIATVNRYMHEWRNDFSSQASRQSDDFLSVHAKSACK